jgi:hypothetical protein
MWAVLRDERVFDPMRLPRDLRDAYRFGIASGDGLVDHASSRALPVPHSLTFIAGGRHRTLITRPELHAAVMQVVC